MIFPPVRPSASWSNRDVRGPRGKLHEPASYACALILEGFLAFGRLARKLFPVPFGFWFKKMFPAPFESMN